MTGSISTLVMADSDIESDPRPRRMVRWVEEFGQVDVLGVEKVDAAHVSHVLPRDSQTGALGKMASRFFRAAKHIYYTKTGQFARSLSTKPMATLAANLKREEYDLIISHDLHLLPLAFTAIKPGGKVIFDAREYYPDQAGNNRLWKFLFGARNEWLCEEFLHRCDHVLTVSHGLQKRYNDEYGVNPELVLSCADFQSIEPKQTNPKTIKLIYHGLANQNRATHQLIKAMSHVDPEYTLDLMIKVSDPRYASKLHELCSQTKNVRIIDTVAFQEIGPTLAQYDLGIFVVPPVNFNLEHCMPNKLFEFVQARLGIVVGPSPDMADFVRENGVGIVTDDFEPMSIARAINALSVSNIDGFKAHANTAATAFSSAEVGFLVKRVIKEVVSRGQ